MYKMLSLEATVYADSDDKYSSIFKISKTKKSWDYYQYLNIVLRIYRRLVWYQGLVDYLYSIKVSCPATAERSMRFPTLKICIESKGSIGRHGIWKADDPPALTEASAHRFFFFLRSRSVWR